jgi:hypothetical protein
VERKAFTAKVARPEPVCEMIARGLVANYHDSYEIYWSLPSGSKLTEAVCVEPFQHMLGKRGKNPPEVTR